MEELLRIDREIAGHEMRIAALKEERRHLDVNRVLVYRERYPVVYVIRETSTARTSGYRDYTCDHGVFHNRIIAEQCLKRHNFSNVYPAHHISIFEVKAEATENVSDEKLSHLDEDVKPPISP